HIRHHVGANLAMAALGIVPRQQTEHSNLARVTASLERVVATASDALPFRRVHVPGFTANVAFVGFDVAGERGAVVFDVERHPETSEHEPRGLLSDAKRTRQLVTRNAVLAVHEEPERGQPLLKSDSGVFEDGADLERELPAGMFGVALPDARLGE